MYPLFYVRLIPLMYVPLVKDLRYIYVNLPKLYLSFTGVYNLIIINNSTIYLCLDHTKYFLVITNN